MSRSSSASAIPDERSNWHRPHGIWSLGKRRHNDFDGSGIPDEGAVRSKRTRFADDNFHHVHRPFYTIREANRPCSEPHYYELRDSLQITSITSSPLPDARDEIVFFKRSANGTSTDLGLRPRSGLEITPHESGHDSHCDGPDILGDKLDDQAAKEVESHFNKRARDTKVERVLRSLISPKSPEADFPLDDVAIDNILYAANEVFFCGRLKRRVRWDWSDKSSAESNSKIIGTTNLREARNGGYETLIVLSPYYLKDEQYNRRLVISTFLHELIHSYLFIRCGFAAKRHGGHTQGFHRIAQLIDDWAGRDTLFLSNMEADLDAFRLKDKGHQCHNFYDCNIQLTKSISGSHRPFSVMAGDPPYV